MSTAMIPIRHAASFAGNSVTAEYISNAVAQPSTAVDSGWTVMQQAVPHVSAPIEKLAAAAMTGISSAKRNGTFGIRYISDNSEPHMKENSSVIECVPQFSLIMYVKM